MQEKTEKPVIFIERKPDNVVPSLTDSKFGGVPYWDMQKEYPVDSYERNMMMIAQINFSQLRDFDVDLPKEGMLQIFLPTKNDSYGIDLDDPTSQEDYRVVFHDTVDFNVTEEQVRALGIITAEECGALESPVLKQVALSFRAGTEDKKSETLGQMLGDPTFIDIDFDPREEMEDGWYFDTLLLQMVSNMDVVMWSDCGIANWFINGEALKKRDFREILYNWDCC